MGSGADAELRDVLATKTKKKNLYLDFFSSTLRHACVFLSNLPHPFAGSEFLRRKGEKKMGVSSGTECQP